MIYAIILILIGSGIRLKAYKTLNNAMYWRVVAPPSFVNKGLYKFIRHPMYLGAMFLTAGISLLLTGSFGIMLLTLWIMFNFCIDRADREEQIMAHTFGDEYIDYMSRTKMFIPFVL